MNTKTNPPGWDAYLATLRELEARHWINPAAAAEMQRAGRTLAMVAWETGADQMTEEAAKIMRRRAEGGGQPCPACKGTGMGRYNGRDYETCPKCDGTRAAGGN